MNGHNTLGRRSFPTDIKMVTSMTLLTTLVALATIIHGRNVQANNSNGEACSRVVSRLAWDGQDPKTTTDFPSIPEFVVICHTVTASCRNQSNCSTLVRAMQSYHMDRKHWDDIGYNFMIGEDGAAYEGRGWDHVGSHSTSYNEKSIAIAFIGSFRERVPNTIALKTAQKLIECGVSKGKIPEEYKLVGHKQVSATISPGEKLFEEIKTWPRWSSNLSKE